MSSFSQHKSLRFTFVLGTGTFSGRTESIYTVDGVRAVVDIEKAGGMTMSTANIRIWGLSMDVMSRLTMLSMQSLSVVRNSLQIDAIEGDAVTTVFSGQIVQAWPDFQTMPDVFFSIEAISGWFDRIESVPPTSYSGDVAVSQVMRTLAVQAGKAFEDNGVTSTLHKPYLSGTVIDKIYQVANAAKIDLFLDDFTLAISPKGKGRSSGQAPVLSSDTGLIGYPQWDQIGITVTTLFNPAIRWGGQVQVITQVSQAAGFWVVQQLSHHLSSEMPDGPWISTLRCTEAGFVPIT